MTITVTVSDLAIGGEGGMTPPHPSSENLAPPFHRTEISNYMPA